VLTLTSLPRLCGRRHARVGRASSSQITTRHPPRTGPAAPITAPIDAQIPIARPRASPEKELPRIARLFGIKSAAPVPWMPRAKNNQGRLGARAQATEAMPKSKVPATRRRTRPKRSPAPPPSGASGAVYGSGTGPKSGGGTRCFVAASDADPSNACGACALPSSQSTRKCHPTPPKAWGFLIPYRGL